MRNKVIFKLYIALLSMCCQIQASEKMGFKHGRGVYFSAIGVQEGRQICDAYERHEVGASFDINVQSVMKECAAQKLGVFFVLLAIQEIRQSMELGPFKVNERIVDHGKIIENLNTQDDPEMRYFNRL